MSDFDDRIKKVKEPASWRIYAIVFGLCVFAPIIFGILGKILGFGQ